MDTRERTADPLEALRIALDARQAKMWTALPGYITKYDATKQTAEVQATVQARQSYVDSDNIIKTKYINLPLCLDVPVFFPSGGGVTMTFPIKAADECLLVFSSRGIDFWWQNTGVQPPAECRMHDLSDAFAFVGFSSKPNVITNISTTTVQIRSDDQSTYWELDPTNQKINMVAPQGLTIKGDVTINNGHLAVNNGDITAPNNDIKAKTISLLNHVHSGVQPGSGNSGAPVP
jgi:hypothetical protein